MDSTTAATKRQIEGQYTPDFLKWARSPVGDRPDLMPAERQGLAASKLSAGLVILAHICTVLPYYLHRPPHTVTTAGAVLGLKRRPLSDPLPTAGRGEIKMWSQASRRNMLRALASVDWEAQGSMVFVTLTYHEVPMDGRLCKSHLRAFRERWQRQWGRPLAAWKLEFQRRGSLHFHLAMVWGGRDLSELRRWVAGAWNAIVAPGDQAHLRAGTQADRAYCNVGEYLAKHGAGQVKEYQHRLPPGFLAVGRWWGLWNLKVSKHTQALTDAQFWAVQRAMRGLRRARNRGKTLRRRARRTRTGRGWRWVHRPEWRSITWLAWDRPQGGLVQDPAERLARMLYNLEAVDSLAQKNSQQSAGFASSNGESGRSPDPMVT